MTSLTLSSSTDYTLTGVTDVTDIRFANVLRGAATATINATQIYVNGFTGMRSVDLAGSSGTNNLVLNVDTIQVIFGGAFALSNWSPSDHITFLGDGQDNYIIGTSVSDTIRGGAGADQLDGGAGGLDQIFGEDGNDLIMAKSGDQVDGGAGVDLLFVDLSTLGGLRIDIRDGGAGRVMGGIKMTGLEALSIKTGIGDDSILGGVAADSLTGGAGNDQLTSGAGRDVLEGEDGDDTLSGGTEQDTMRGGTGKDLLLGGAGGDYLQGGTGSDTLTGGTGADRFVFATLGESNLAGGIDRITDFVQKSDKIDLIGLEIGNGMSFTPYFFIGETEFGPPTAFYGQVRWYQDATTTHIEIRGPFYDTMQIDLAGLYTLTREDFIL